MKKLSIYIHIPFCMSKCYYCDFLSGTSSDKNKKDYMHSLAKEIVHKAVNYKDCIVHTIFIGGGTPTSIKAEDLCKILKLVQQKFQVASDAEITIEANPGTVTQHSLNKYIKAGINRISFGLQSANNEELVRLGRIHTYEYFLYSYEMAVKAGFTNINVDLISAIPEQSPEDFENTLRKVTSLEPKPTHISVYSLIIEENTPFYDMYGEESRKLSETGEKQPHLPSEEEERKMYEDTLEILNSYGYHRYEISNYALTSYECEHNKVYWNRGNYVGFGLGAASLIDNIRITNVRDLTAYKQCPWLMADTQCLSLDDRMAEFMFLGLRMINGVSKQAFYQEFQRSMDDIYGDVLRENEDKGLLIQVSASDINDDGNIKEATLRDDKCDTYIRLTEKGLDVANIVMAQFLGEE